MREMGNGVIYIYIARLEGKEDWAAVSFTFMFHKGTRSNPDEERVQDEL
jgi:hypothetical protein